MPDTEVESTTDTLLGGRVTLRQPAKGYRAAIDPVLLAAAVPATTGQSVLELGCGAGAALFCLAARVSGLRLTGVEIQPEMVSYAEENAHLNAALGDFTLFSGDVRAMPPSIAVNGFDHVMANPPYHAVAAYDAGESVPKTTAHAMPSADLTLWVKAAHSRLKHHGSLTLIYRADGLVELLAALHPKFGNLLIYPLWPRQGQPAKRVIVQGKKDSKAPLKLLSGLSLHDGESYAVTTAALLRSATPLHLLPKL